MRILKIAISSKANANIALIKYWGKRDENAFLPTKSSLGVTLDKLETVTTVENYAGIPPLRGGIPDKSGGELDRIVIDNKVLSYDEASSVRRLIDIFRIKGDPRKAGVALFIDSKNSFPTAAGLASSASGFAALAKSLNKFYNLNLSKKELSALARQGSGSACRSIHDGFVIWHDTYAKQLFAPSHWPGFRVIVAVLDESRKKISSRLAMKRTVDTSPLYKGWVKNSQARIEPMIEAIRNHNLEKVGKLAEQDCLEMHECIRTSKPTIDYFSPKTKVVIEQVKKIRASGVPCYFTIDAGPNVKIITTKEHTDKILKSLKARLKGYKNKPHFIVCTLGVTTPL